MSKGIFSELEFDVIYFCRHTLASFKKQYYGLCFGYFLAYKHLSKVINNTAVEDIEDFLSNYSREK